MGTVLATRIQPYTVLGTDISPTADIPVSTMRHVLQGGTSFGKAYNATPTTTEEIIYVASGAGTISGFHCMLYETGSSTSVAFDLKKNGVSILSAAVTITNTDADREVFSGTLSNNSMVADDVFTISITVTSSTGAQGPRAWANFVENSAPA